MGPRFVASAPSATPVMVNVTAFSPPLSGAVLDVLVDVLDLRRWDSDGVLATRNARRYFSGERVSPEAESRVQRALADAVIASELVPATLSFADLLPLTPPQVPEVPAAAIVHAMIAGYAERWDALAGALRRLTAPVAFPRHAGAACLRLVAVDLAVRVAALLWLVREGSERPVSDFWTTRRGVGDWLRSLVEASGLTLDLLAAEVLVHPNTLDGWLYDDVKPSFENMNDLARALAGRDAGNSVALLRRIRLAFAARDLFRRIEAIVGTPQALGICQRVAVYTNEMLRLPRASTMPGADNDTKMRFALATGAIGADKMGAKWIVAMVTHLWRHEHNPVWRTTLRAVTGSWFTHLQEITAKLGPFDRTGLTEVFGRVPTDEDLDVLAFRVQASKDEEAREPGKTEAMLAETVLGGDFGALELTLQANEASARGDRLAAIDLLRAAVAGDSTNAEIHFRLGCNPWQIGDVNAGLFELEVAVQFDPSWDRPRVDRRQLFLPLGDNYFCRSGPG